MNDQWGEVFVVVADEHDNTREPHWRTRVLEVVSDKPTWDWPRLGQTVYVAGVNGGDSAVVDYPRVEVDVPMRCVATFDTDKRSVVKVTFLPCEGDAGYFGRKASRVDTGEEFTRVWDEFWDILRGLPDDIVWEG